MITVIQEIDMEYPQWKHDIYTFLSANILILLPYVLIESIQKCSDQYALQTAMDLFAIPNKNFESRCAPIIWNPSIFTEITILNGGGWGGVSTNNAAS